MGDWLNTILRRKPVGESTLTYTPTSVPRVSSDEGWQVVSNLKDAIYTHPMSEPTVPASYLLRNKRFFPFQLESCSVHKIEDRFIVDADQEGESKLEINDSQDCWQHSAGLVGLFLNPTLARFATSITPFYFESDFNSTDHIPNESLLLKHSQQILDLAREQQENERDNPKHCECVEKNFGIHPQKFHLKLTYEPSPRIEKSLTYYSQRKISFVRWSQAENDLEEKKLFAEVFSKDGHKVLLLGVLSGHQGLQSVDFLSTNLATKLRKTLQRSYALGKMNFSVLTLVNTFLSINEKLHQDLMSVKNDNSGVNYHISLIWDYCGESYVICFNLGDLKSCLLSKVGSKGELLALSVEAKASHPFFAKEVLSKGGEISPESEDSVPRVAGILAVTDSFGDNFTSGSTAQCISHQPKVTYFKQDSTKQQDLLICSSGVNETISSRQLYQAFNSSELSGVENDERLAAMMSSIEAVYEDAKMLAPSSASIMHISL